MPESLCTPAWPSPVCVIVWHTLARARSGLVCVCVCMCVKAVEYTDTTRSMQAGLPGGLSGHRTGADCVPRTTALLAAFVASTHCSCVHTHTHTHACPPKHCTHTHTHTHTHTCPPKHCQSRSQTQQSKKESVGLGWQVLSDHLCG